VIGTVLGKYRIEAELSRGGMGAVYRARHEVLERPFAIKVLRPDIATTDELVQRFVNEAKAASAIQHPSIIRVFDFGYTDDNQAYLVMEFLDGESLATRIAIQHRLSEQDAVRIIRSLTGALGAAHAKGIIHRDLKPDNIFLVPDPDLGERAKILDFGIAKLTEAKGNTMTGVLMGTPLYMAPEQAQSASTIDQRADLYSLGCIFYELLTGKPPLVGEGAGEIIAMHMFTEPDPPSSVVRGIDPGLEKIVMKLLAKDPGDRYASAADVSNALSAVFGASTVRPATPLPWSAEKLPTVAAAPSLIGTPVRGSRTANLPWIAACIALALVGIVAVVIALQSRSDKPAPPPATVDTTPAPPIQTAPSPAPSPVVAPAPPAPVAKPHPPRPSPTAKPTHTRKGSPIEVDVD
jgi:serine/threonine-protein kinase